MKLIDDKLTFLREEIETLVDHCESLGDEKTRQLLLEVGELLEVTHSTFLGKTLKSISDATLGKQRKH
ncbi:hypothetical protein PN836_017130 [Ningiella sp. W23]|uniref:hypothetical protein n=1 Tax=Ningiella sp. W23 TaxID=3023715 RepID=UPI00375740BF